MKSAVQNSQMQNRIIRAFQAKHDDRTIGAVYEHGQWWVHDFDNGAQWSVIDAEGPGTVDGFDFELVTPGDEE